MALTTQQRIRLQELLLQREALYARVHAIESQINRIFGAEYPLPPPPVDVADGKTKPPPKKKKAAKSSSPPKVRALERDETVYRVRYLPDAGASDEIHVDRKAIEALLQSPMAGELIEAVETLSAEGKLRERLYPEDDGG